MNMLSFVRTRLLATALLLVASVAQAAPVYLETFLSLQQTAGPTVVASPNAGFNLWSTTFQLTNMTGTALNDVKLWYTGPRLNGIDAVWDDTTSVFKTADATLSGYNNDTALLYGLSDLPDLLIFGVDDADTLPVWNLGSMGVGQSVSVTLVRELTANVGQLNSISIQFTQTAATVPEPGSLLLVGLALSVLATSTARRPRKD
ncbi:PEP-CTERM sorting domain-containing protein [Roseateles sp. P5_E7]